jgi:transposase
MGTAIALREDYEAGDLRRLAGRARDAKQARRLLALAAVYDGKDRAEAARIGAMDRQTLRDWVHRFNEEGPDGLRNVKPSGRPPKLSAEQRRELERIVEAGPDPAKDGVVRWRCVDLRRVIMERFGVDIDEVSIGRVLKELDFAHVSARPQHREQDEEAMAAFKKTSPPMSWRR